MAEGILLDVNLRQLRRWNDTSKMLSTLFYVHPLGFVLHPELNPGACSETFSVVVKSFFLWRDVGWDFLVHHLADHCLKSLIIILLVR